jgi:rhodanese-related sulfurtransferase
VADLPFAEISTEEVLARLQAGERLNLIDIREPHEWEMTGVIPGAQLIPMRPFLLQHLSDLDKEAEYILVCRSGARTFDAAVYMAYKGFKQPKSMKGGILQWTGPLVPPDSAE